MKVAIMQPYILPYIGYFQLINAVDVFVVYDNIQYSKKGWINRNRFLQNGKDEYFSFPLKKDSDYLDVKDRFLSDNWPDEKLKMLRKINENYKKAPNFEESFPIIEKIFSFENVNLFEFIFHSLKVLNAYFDIDTKIIVSSTLEIDHTLKGQEKVLAICKNLGASHYINPIGGLELYSQQVFQPIELSFIKAEKLEYPQYKNEFVPWLSVLDIMMFNNKAEIKKMLEVFTLQKN